MFCPKCGNEIPDGSSFCSKCGEKISDISTANQPSPASPASSAVVATPVKSNYLKLPIIIGVAVVVVIVAAVIIYNVFFAPYDIDEKRFPDVGLRSALTSQVDIDKDARISRDEASAIESLEIYDAASISGLDIFPNLRSLVVGGNNLISVDIDGCQALEFLGAGNCDSLSEVKIGNAANLKSAYLSEASINTIDVSKAKSLEIFVINDNPLSELDVSSNAKLTTLDVGTTDITTLDLSGNPELTTLDCDNAVILQNLDATPLHEYWVMKSFENNGLSSGSSKYNQSATATYDENGNLGTLKIAGNSSPSVSLEYTYDDQNRLTKVKRSSSGSYSSTSTTEVSYDESGHFVSAVETCPTGSYTLTNTDKVTYGSNGLPVHVESIVDQGGALMYDFTYDESANLTTVRQYGAMDVTYAVTNDDEGRIIKMTPTKSDGYSSAGIYEISYDEQGNITSANYTNTYGSGNGSYTSTITYAPNGQATNGVRTVKRDSSAKYVDASIDSCAFTYNEHGLLTKIVPKYSGVSGDYKFAFEYERLLLTRGTAPNFNFVNLDNILQPSLQEEFWNPVEYCYQDDLAYARSMKTVLMLVASVKQP